MKRSIDIDESNKSNKSKNESYNDTDLNDNLSENTDSAFVDIHTDTNEEKEEEEEEEKVNLDNSIKLENGYNFQDVLDLLNKNPVDFDIHEDYDDNNDYDDKFKDYIKMQKDDYLFQLAMDSIYNPDEIDLTDILFMPNRNELQRHINDYSDLISKSYDDTFRVIKYQCMIDVFKLMLDKYDTGLLIYQCPWTENFNSRDDFKPFNDEEFLCYFSKLSLHYALSPKYREDFYNYYLKCYPEYKVTYDEWQKGLTFTRTIELRILNCYRFIYQILFYISKKNLSPYDEEEIASDDINYQ
jgi:hypothetical protein